MRGHTPVPPLTPPTPQLPPCKRGITAGRWAHLACNKHLWMIVAHVNSVCSQGDATISMKSVWPFIRAHLCPLGTRAGPAGMGGQHPRLRNPTWARLGWMTWEEAARGFHIVQHMRPTYTLRWEVEIQETRSLPSLWSESSLRPRDCNRALHVWQYCEGETQGLREQWAAPDPTWVGSTWGKRSEAAPRGWRNLRGLAGTRTYSHRPQRAVLGSRQCSV